MKAIIVGGGIAGLTAAIALTKVGIDAHVYERVTALREVGAGIGLMANALRALDVLGLDQSIRAQSLAGVQGALRNRRGKFLLPISAYQLARRFGLVAVMHRAELLNLLVESIEPERLHLDNECTGFDQNRSKVIVQFHNGNTAEADVLIGADGLRSLVRTQLFGEQRVSYSGYTAWRAVVEYPPQNLIMGETWGRGCRFGIIPATRDRVYWFATQNTAEGERDPAGKTIDSLLRLFQGWHEPIEALIKAAKEDSILRNDIYDMDPLPYWSSGRITLLGDAAHAMTPNLGQGACQGMEDALVLAACLKKQSSVKSALLEYEERRIPRTGQVTLRSRAIGAIAQQSNPVVCWIRNVAMRATPGSIIARQLKSLVDVETLTSSEKALFG